MHVDTESIPSEGEQAPLPVPAEKAYDKSTSFFDSISCESLDRLKDDSDGGNARSDRRRHERSLNAETFGRAANDRCASSTRSIAVLWGPPSATHTALPTCVHDVGGCTTAVARGATALPARTRPTVAPARVAATSPWTTTGPPEAEVSPQLVVAMLPPSEEPPAPRRDSWYEPSSALATPSPLPCTLLTHNASCTI